MRRLSLLMAAGLILTACERGGAPEVPEVSAPPGATHVVVDTDMGLDDALAILYLARRDALAIDAVTVSGTGLVHCTPGVRNARALLALSGRGDVPVACGRETPLRGSNVFPGEWRAAADDLYGLALPVPKGEGYPGDAVDLLTVALDGNADLLTLGPLTNVAEALREDPALADRVDHVVSMAGAVRVPGNTPEGLAEYNVWADPVAADEVLEGLPVTLVPLDTTNRLPVTRFFVEALGRHTGTPQAEAAYDLVADDEFLMSGQYYFWDPLAAVLFAEPNLASYRVVSVVMTTSTGTGAGWIQESPRGAAIAMAMEVDPLAFEREYLTTLAGEAVHDVRPPPDVTVTFDGRRCALEGRTTGVENPVVVMFRNNGELAAMGVMGSLKGTTYRELLAFIGRPGSLVREEPKGFRDAVFLSAEPGATALQEVAFTTPRGVAVCAIQEGEGGRVWPGGPLAIRGV